MSFLDEVHAKRQKLAAVLVDEDYSGIRAIVEELYPDRAHFLFELLQNAEDTKATEVWFDLRPDKLIFEHDGRPFDESDVWGITNIGKGTKKGQEDKIGQFGVGFKAVFAYSETPHIWSPTFCFKITDLVLPSEVAPINDLGNKTRFEFPFNNPKKSPTDAFQEVDAGLRGLAETTLLFLSHLKIIHWRVGKDATGKVLRTQHSEHHVEVVRESNGKVTGNSHFLKFDRSVKELDKQRVAVAFALDFLPNIKTFDPGKPLAKELKIVPANPSRVAVFFPADKESSGLRFHLHAPFVPELSRASIKETPANLPLFDQLAEVTASSLLQIRDLGLLTIDFLATLPNPQDSIPARYQCIRSAIVEEMNTEPLTPTYAKSHAPAQHLVQAGAPLKSLLSDADIELLVDYEDEPPQWAVSASQKNSNVDRFLEGLAIQEWGIEEFVRVLRNKTASTQQPGRQESCTPEQVAGWLREKPIEWHQEFYALLQTEDLSKRKWDTDHFSSLQIVRLTDGTYGAGNESFFVGDGIEHDEALRRVDPGVYTSGKSKVQKENAKAFLEAIGVREVGEAELVEAILKRRYTQEAQIPDEKTYRKDLKRFVALVEKEPDKASLFADYFVFQGIDKDNWWTPGCVFLDKPFVETGLSIYYAAIGEKADRVALSEGYENCGVSATKLVKFAQAVGVQRELEVKETRCHANPERKHLYSVGGARFTSPIDRDYTIEGLEEALAEPLLAISKLIWNTMRSQAAEVLRAVYRRNESGGCHFAASQLVHLLRGSAWIPQSEGRFVCPAEASRDLLPGGFPFDPDWDWIEAIEFGKQLAEKSQEQVQKRALARQLGFTDDETFDRAKRFAALPVDEQQRILAQQEPFELPDREPANPTRRAERVAEQAASAAERVTEQRPRSVSINRDAVKQEAGQYLCQQYTNADGQMMCQVCKKRLPFQLDDGTDYFERVEFLSTLKRHHKQNYLALCPNHAAMFQHANGSADKLRDMVMDLVGNSLSVVLAKDETTIYFTKTHVADLKAIVTVDEGDADVIGDEAIDDIAPTVLLNQT